MSRATLGRAPKPLLAGAAALVVVVVVIVVLVSGGSSSSTDPQATPGADGAPAAKPTFAGDGYPNADRFNTRKIGGPITAKTVGQLKLAWSRPLTAQSQYGSHASSPIVTHGVVYSQDLVSNVKAIDLRTGATLWTKQYNSPDQGPNGIVIAGGRVFGATADSAFALDQKTGKELWSIKLVHNPNEGIDMAPGAHAGLVYVSTVPGNNQTFYSGGAGGVLWALDAKTGKQRWKFDTAPTKRWSAEHTDINSGGGVWHTPSFDDEGNMYFGVGNPGPFPGNEEYPWGSSRPGPNLYTDSLVKLDAATGKLRWYFQLTPHDLYDWDLQDPPILVDIKGRPAVVTAGKAGIVIAVDRKTGKLLWKRPVGQHSGHDKDNLYAMKRQYDKIRIGDEVYPGLLGGVIAPLSTDGTTVFAPVVNNSVTYSAQTQQQGGATATGQIVAVDLATGKVKWDVQTPAAAFGATTVVNDLVFATTMDGTLMALETKSGKEAWKVQLPAGSNTGVTISGDTVIAPAGLAANGGQPAIAAYRLKP